MGVSGRFKPIVLGFLFVIGIPLTEPFFAFGAGLSFRRSGSFKASRIHGQHSFSIHRKHSFPIHGKHSFSQPFHHFGFVGVDRGGDQQVIIIQHSVSAPTHTEPARNKVYVRPRWVDGGHGVEILEPGYWTVPK
jgi:hypothetical protein